MDLIQIIANVGLTFLFLIFAAIMITWVGEKL